MTHYGFIINTDSYSGNFERELCAHLTGCIGECEVGEEMVEPDIREQFNKIIMLKADEHACYRPVEVHGPKAEDVIIYFKERPSPDLINLMISRAETYNDARLKKDRWYSKNPANYKPIVITGFSLVKCSAKEETIETF